MTLALTGVYLASFQFRASFLLRRLTVLSVFLWIPVAQAVSGLVRSSLGPVSDLVYRRLAMLEVLSVEHHPWRLFSAMTDRATVMVIGTVMLTTALSRRRLSLRSLFAMVAVMTVGMIAHHLAVLLAPIERYDRPVWADIVPGSNAEVVLAIVAASIVTLLARARPDQASASTTVAADRDPVIFAVVDGDTTAPPLRIVIALAMVVLVATVVMRT